MDISIFGSEAPTPQIWKKQKKICCFLGFLAHLEQNNF